MLLVVDSGNTNIVFALYDNHHESEKPIAQWRLQNVPLRTSDEYGGLLAQFLNQHDASFADIEGLVISSVVPAVEENLSFLWRDYISHARLAVVGKDGFVPDMAVLIDNPLQLGADRLINGWQAFRQYQSALIVVDFGTATTFDVVNGKGQYCGGIIAPGIQLSMNALVQGTAKLPNVDFKKPEKIIGTNTKMAMQSGFFYGMIGTVETLINRIKHQMDDVAVKIIATGGYAGVIAQECPMIEAIDNNITLNGLVALYHERIQ